MVFGPEFKVLCYQVRPVSLVSKHRCMGEGYTHKYVENDSFCCCFVDVFISF